MSDQDGLGVLHVRTSRHNGVPDAHRLIDERLSDLENTIGEVARLLAQVGANERRDLVVARATCTQLSPQRGSGSLNEAALKRRVHVLIVHAGNENSRRDISVEPRQRGVHIRALPIVQQADAVKLIRVRMRARDVNVSQPEIEVGRYAQRCQRLGRTARKTATPQRHVRFELRHCSS